MVCKYGSMFKSGNKMRECDERLYIQEHMGKTAWRRLAWEGKELIGYPPTLDKAQAVSPGHIL